MNRSIYQIDNPTSHYDVCLGLGRFLSRNTEIQTVQKPYQLTAIIPLLCETNHILGAPMVRFSVVAQVLNLIQSAMDSDEHCPLKLATFHYF